MAKGRKTTPKSIQRLRGNPRKRQLNASSDPDFETAVPSAPPNMTGHALTEWDRITQELAVKQIITLVDMSIIAVYCQTYADWIHHTEQLINEDEIITSTRGVPQINPRIKLVSRLREELAKYSSEIGITPTSRNKVKMVANTRPNPTREEALAEKLFTVKVKQ